MVDKPWIRQTFFLGGGQFCAWCVKPFLETQRQVRKNNGTTDGNQVMQDSSCLGSGLRRCQCFLGSLQLCGCQPDLPHSLFQISYGLSPRPLSHWLFGAAMWFAWLLEAEHGTHMQHGEWWSEYDKDNCDNGSGLKLYHPWNIDLRQATFLPSYFLSCHHQPFQSCHFAHLNTIVKVLIETKHLLQSLELGGLTTNLDK